MDRAAPPTRPVMRALEDEHVAGPRVLHAFLRDDAAVRVVDAAPLTRHRLAIDVALRDPLRAGSRVRRHEAELDVVLVEAAASIVAHGPEEEAEPRGPAGEREAGCQVT
jgi:hypothetical protein